MKHDGVSDIVDVFNDLLVILGLPGSGANVELMEHSLGQMSELLTSFHHAVRRAAPQALYREVSGGAADEAKEDEAISADEAKPEERIPGATRGEIYLMRLRSYLEHFAGRAAEVTPRKWADPAGAVQVMTIHQAKGLEFPSFPRSSKVDSRLQ